MTDKMREAFEKWYLMQPIAHKSHIVRISNGHYFGAHTETAWQAWQAAQSAQAVPVVGEVPTAEQVGEEIGMHAGAWDCIDPDKIIAAVLKLSKPTHSISAAELERLRKCEAVLIHVRSLLPMDKWADDSRRMIDAAIAAEGEK